MNKTLLYLSMLASLATAANETAEGGGEGDGGEGGAFTADFAFVGRMGVTAIVIIKLLGLVLVEKRIIIQKYWARFRSIAYLIISMLVFVIVVEVGDNVAEMIFALDEAAHTNGYEKWIRTFSYYSSYTVTASVSLAFIRQAEAHWAHRSWQIGFVVLVLIGAAALTILNKAQYVEMLFAIIITMQLFLWLWLKGRSLAWMVPAQVGVMLAVLFVTATLRKDNPALDSLRAATLSIKALTLEPMLGLFFETAEDVFDDMEKDVKKEDEEQELKKGPSPA